MNAVPTGRPGRVVAGLALAAIATTAGAGVLAVRPRAEAGDGVADGAKEQASVVVVASGELRGWLEPCGCSEGQVGGLARRASWIARLRERLDRTGVEGVLHLDTGDLTGPKVLAPALLELEARTALEALATTGCAAVAVGDLDLRLGAAKLAELGAATGVPLLAANVAHRGVEGDARFPFARVVRWRAPGEGPRLTITAAIGASLRPAVESDPALQWLEPADAIAAALATAGDAPAILLFHGDLDEAAAVAKRVAAQAVDGAPTILLTIAGHGVENPDAPIALADGGLVLGTGDKGKRVVEVGLEPAADDGPLRAVARAGSLMRASIPDDRAVRSILDRFWAEATAIGGAGLERPPVESGGKFIGSDACSGCHRWQYDIWKKQKHARAFTAMEEKDPKRARAPECLECHTTGYRFESGLRTPAEDPHLASMGCEMCHGVGSVHAMKPEAGFGRMRERHHWKARCEQCHDADNSPAFDFDRYMETIRHWKRRR